MKAKLATVVAVVLTGAFAANVSAAEDARLKEILRTLTLRLRAAETEKNSLLSEKAQFEQEKKALAAKLDELTTQAAAERELIDTLTTKTTEQEKELTDTKESLAKWKSAHEQVMAAAQKAETERRRLAGEAIELRRKLDDRERKNAELGRIAKEILTRYEKFGLGDALAAREPFTGITRVKLENLVQDYQDKITDQRAKPEQ